jgi:hypothetical protein
MYCAPTVRDRNAYVNNVIQWSQTNAMISAVGIVLSLFLIFYSIHTEDGVVFLFSVCNVIIQSVIVCSPVFNSPNDLDSLPVYTTRPYRPYPLQYQACSPLRPRTVLHFESFPMKYSQKPPNDIVIL